MMSSSDNATSRPSVKGLATDVHLSTTWQTILVIFLLFLTSRVYETAIKRPPKRKYAGEDLTLHKSIISALPHAQDVLSTVAPTKKSHSDSVTGLLLFKDLYFKLHNLEQFPEVLPQSRDLLIALLSETSAGARNDLEPGVLAVEQYSPGALERFMRAENDRTTCAWERYVARRKAGSPREMFQDKDEAVWWLRQMAPVKYVDGAWLGHVNKITTPFALRRATKDAWQVMSEELGDGNFEMNHVRVYRELMRDIGAGLPEASSVEFISEQHQLHEECVWKAALSQLLISLFPHEFLPEILGFNLHFEGLTMETMKAAKELEELGINPYYFVLHISIDNADSGHTAIAMQAVIKYMEHILQSEGVMSADRAWKRVQAGFILSKELSKGPQCPSQHRQSRTPFPNNKREAEIIEIFKAKAPVAHRVHSSSRIKLGGRRLDDWFNTDAWANKQWQQEFLYLISDMKPWVRKGESNNSKLVHELSWGGRMFGSFTDREVEVLKRWIDGLGHPDPRLYWSFVGRSEIKSDVIFADQDIRVDYPVLSPSTTPGVSLSGTKSMSPPPLKNSSTATSHANPDMSVLLPLWFTCPCLLESFVCIPSKTTTIAASSIVRLLRAQYGFDAEGPGVAGMDEARRTDSVGIVELGLEMIQSLGVAQPSSLRDVLETWPSEFALRMLEWSMRPMENSALLLGLTSAFVGLHDAMTSSPLLSTANKAVLMQIACRERACLQVSLEGSMEDKTRVAEFHRGYNMGRLEIDRCFG